MCEFGDGPLRRGGDSGSQAVTHSWALRSNSRPPGLNVYPADVALPLHLLCYLLCCLQPPRRTLHRCKTKAAAATPPPPFL